MCQIETSLSKDQNASALCRAAADRLRYYTRRFMREVIAKIRRKNSHAVARNLVLQFVGRSALGRSALDVGVRAPRSCCKLSEPSLHSTSRCRRAIHFIVHLWRLRQRQQRGALAHRLLWTDLRRELW